jgi:hypothetical protein
VTSPSFTFGTHNLHDRAGVPTFYADVLIFTEAIAPTILAKARQRAAHAAARLSGYAVVVCREQPDLVIAYRRRLFKRAGRYSYQRLVDGIPGVTPNRGTLSLPLQHRRTGDLFYVNAEHRINAAFPPYIRGEATFRRMSWGLHTRFTCNLVTRQSQSGYTALSGGDLNVPPDRLGYPDIPGAQELQRDLQRLAVTPAWRWSLSHPEHLSLKGSDHPRDRVTVTRRQEAATA